MQKKWVVNTRATKHVYNGRSAFTFYTPISDGEVVYLGESRTLVVTGKRECTS